ncbi:MAG: hypothetical protein ACD_10C00176G0002 [uncultured bacterium]|nr:MAG: hypothetical protein ACD_10C00176G0002 [uncultured bacterium]
MRQGAAITAFNIFSFARRRAQGHRDIVSDLIAGDGNHRGIANRALRPDGNIRCAAADIDQADAKILFIFGEHRVAGSQRLQHQIIDFEAAAPDAFDNILRRRNSAGDNVRLHLQAHAAHADRLADAILSIDDELLRQDMQDFLIGRNRHCFRRLDDAVNVAGGHFFILDRHHAVGVETLDVTAGNARIYVLHLAVGHQFNLLNDSANGMHRIFDIHHHAFFQAARILRAHADYIEMAFLVDLGDQGDDFRRPDIQANDQFFIVPAHIVTSPCPRLRHASQNHSDSANRRPSAALPVLQPLPDKPR